MFLLLLRVNKKMDVPHVDAAAKESGGCGEEAEKSDNYVETALCCASRCFIVRGLISF